MVHPPTSPFSETSLLEITKIVAGFLGGGAAGALLTEWFRRRRSKVRAIPLIERVNRLLSPELQDITLARRAGTPDNPRLEELENLREYQLTLRNTSRVHLKDAEIQFEFPADDVQAWASRPTMSKTALLEVDAKATGPWKKAFRWSIPHLPSGDSVEFTFRAVNPSSGDFEASLYKSEGIIIKRVIGELPLDPWIPKTLLYLAIFLFAASLSAQILEWRVKKQEESNADTLGDQVTKFNLVGCKIKIASFYKRTANGIWYMGYRIDNVGDRTCVVKLDKISPDPIVLNQGHGWHTEIGFGFRPIADDVGISISSSDKSEASTFVRVYTTSGMGDKIPAHDDNSTE